MRKKYQKGGFKYDKAGNTSITSKDVNKINKDRVGIASMQQGGELPVFQTAGRFRKDASHNMMTQSPTLMRNPEDLFNNSYGVQQSWTTSPTPSNPNQPFTGYGVPMPKTPWEASGVTNKNYGRTVDAGGVAQQPAIIFICDSACLPRCFWYWYSVSCKRLVRVAWSRCWIRVLRWCRNSGFSFRNKRVIVSSFFIFSWLVHFYFSSFLHRSYSYSVFIYLIYIFGSYRSVAYFIIFKTSFLIFFSHFLFYKL